MRTITEEQINQIIDEVQCTMAKNIQENFLNDVQQIPEEYKNNQLAYYQVLLANAQRNSAITLKAVLCKLLVK